MLASTPIPIPRDGDDESLRAHKARMALAPLRSAAMCGSCHRSFLDPATGNPAHLVGQDELGAWQRSPYAGSLATRIDEPVRATDCRGCHMPLEAAPGGDAAAKDGKIHSHRFAGGNSWLAAMRGDTAQLEAVKAMLRGAASIDVAVATAADGTRTLPADGAPVVAGQSITLDVVVRNESTGHRFPGGVVDAQDTWIEVAVRDARGKIVRHRPARPRRARATTPRRMSFAPCRETSTARPSSCARRTTSARPSSTTPSRHATPRSCATGSTYRPRSRERSCRSR